MAHDALAFSGDAGWRFQLTSEGDSAMVKRRITANGYSPYVAETPVLNGASPCRERIRCQSATLEPPADAVMPVPAQRPLSRLREKVRVRGS